MRISVCIKQVPDVGAPMELRGGELVLDAGRMVLNACDASAVEAALVLAEGGGAIVDLVCIGPDRVRQAIRKALAMGADAATHLRTDAENLDSKAHAELLAGHLAGAGHDLILCGSQAQDTGAGLTGPRLAERLGLPYATNAVGLAVEAGMKVVVTRRGDAGRERVELPVPCLVTCSDAMNEPRIPDLKGIRAAMRKSVHVRDVAPAEVGRAAVRRLGYEPVPEREEGLRLEGEPAAVAGRLLALLHGEARVL